jgi:hypothetical protein
MTLLLVSTPAAARGFVREPALLVERLFPSCEREFLAAVAALQCFVPLRHQILRYFPAAGNIESTQWARRTEGSLEQSIGR